MLLWLPIFLLTSCTTKQTPTEDIQVTLIADGATTVFNVPPGSTVNDVLNIANKTLNELDKIDPPTHSLVTAGTVIKITRVIEEFDVVEETIPFEQQLQPSEFLAEGEQKTIQLGENGIREITFRRIIEDNTEISRTPIKTAIIKEPKPQIILVGVKSSFSPMDIPGRIVYLADGNAWMMEQNTANRTPIITSGDLDGRIFELSNDGNWLLFSRDSQQNNDKGEEDSPSPQHINSLWAIKIDEPDHEYDLGISDVIHFASWKPNAMKTIGFSTVEPRETSPGWQANNNLIEGNFTSGGYLTRKETVLETNSGGIYGWWGTDFAYSIDGDKIAYSRPSEIGYINIADKELISLKNIVPYQTRSDWAWVPGISWSPDDHFLFTIDHETTGNNNGSSPEESTTFNLVALSIDNGHLTILKPQVGMFAYPLTSPQQSKPNGEKAFFIAFLQAIIPNESDISRYRVSIIDRDGSNWEEVFPSKDMPGMEPTGHWGAWSPDALDSTGNFGLAVLYKGDIWIIDPFTKESHQITGDGRITRIDWH